MIAAASRRAMASPRSWNRTPCGVEVSGWRRNTRSLIVTTSGAAVGGTARLGAWHTSTRQVDAAAAIAIPHLVVPPRRSRSEAAELDGIVEPRVDRAPRPPRARRERDDVDVPRQLVAQHLGDAPDAAGYPLHELADVNADPQPRSLGRTL